MADYGYVGNPDYRGYLSYLANNPNDPNSNIASTALQFVGNDGGIDQGNFSKAASGAFGGQALRDFVTSSYGTYNGYANPGSVLGTSATNPSADQNLIGQYDQGIGNVNRNINNLGSQQQTGLSAIDASYQDAINQLLTGKSQASASYGTAKNQSAQGYVGAKNTIGSQAGSLLNGLQRLLGSRGAGGGSAYLQAAPQAVARGASLQRADVGNTFGQNNQALDTNWGNYLQGYGNSVNSAVGQKDRAQSTLQQNIDAGRQGLLQSLAQLQSQRATAAGGNPVTASQSALDQANALGARTYSTAPISANTQAFQAPSLANYTTAPQSINTNQQAGSDYFSPYLQTLLGKKQQQAFA